MLDFIYTLFIAPLEFSMDKALSWGYELTGNWGWAIIIMSIVVNTVILPIYLKAEHWQEEERSIRKSFENDEAMIKRAFKGQERFAMITTMHRQAGYSPFLTLRSSIGFFLQIPFFFAAYHLLSNFEPFQGISFLGLTDLSKPDELFTIGGFAINVMPILMTVINIGSALIYTQNLSNRDKYQLYGMAAIFLVLLYNAASGLVLYWTFNNIYSFAKNALITFAKSWTKPITIHRKTSQNTPAYCALLPLVVLTPCSFLWAHNLPSYTTQALLVSSSLLLTVSACLYFSLKSIHARFPKIEKNLIFKFSFSVILGLTLLAFSVTIIRGTFFNIRWHFVWILPLLSCFVIYFFGYKLLKYVLICQLIFSLGIGFYNLGYEYERKVENFGSSNSEGISITFKQKPNIYLIFCESYQNLDSVKKIYGYDSSNFLNQLEALDFRIYNNIYSNSNYTFGSLTDILTMKLRTGVIGNLDASQTERNIIGGNYQNTLFRIFKENGYSTGLFVNGSPYFFHQKGEYLDYTDYTPNLLLQLFKPILDTNELFTKLLPIYIETEMSITPSQYLDLVLKKNKTIKPKLFIYYFDVAQHTPTKTGYTYHLSDQWIKSNFYQSRIRKGNQELLKICDSLRKNDPEAIIILIGDHASIRLRKFPFKYPGDIRENLHALEKIGETYDSAIDDNFHVFAAIHWSKGFNDTLEQFSHVNLFSHLITRLSGNDSSTVYPNFSIYSDQDGHQAIMAIDGQPNKDFLFWSPETFKSETSDY